VQAESVYFSEEARKKQELLTESEMMGANRAISTENMADSANKIPIAH